MKKRRRLRKGLAILLSIAMVLGLMPGVGTIKVSAAEEGSAISSTVIFNATPSKPAGDGTESSPYEISTVGELYWFAGLVNGTLDGVTQNKAANAVLTADIDLSGIDNWTPIGNEANQYTGTFDGQNHTVKDMSITEQGNSSGLFGYINNATIKNIKITGAITITAESYTEGYGSIVGRMEHSTVTNCHSSVNITIDSTMESTAGNCIGHIGGIVGKMHEANSAIANCSYSGTIELNDKPVNVAAGIVGYAINTTLPITNCSFTGTINSTYSGKTIIGGIFGYTRSTGDVKVTNCLSVGTITKSGDTSLTGILIGQINGGYGNNAVKNNYYSSSSSLNVFGTITGTPTTAPATICTEEQLASGEVAYLLQGEQTVAVWGQNLDNDQTKQNYPVPGGAKVYKNITYQCPGSRKVVKAEYSNTEKDAAYGEHDMKKVETKAATCIETGNIEHWVCSYEKGVYYQDEKGTNTYDTVVSSATGHNFGEDRLCTRCGASDTTLSKPKGEGTTQSPYQISTVGELNWFAGLVNGDASVCTGGVTQNTSANAVLTKDINFGDNNFAAIGTEANPFSGTFDGNGHTITVNQKESSEVALFGFLGNSTVKNLTVTGTINTASTKFAAGIAMQTKTGTTATVENCISDVTIE